jgi:hypothetical protein
MNTTDKTGDTTRVYGRFENSIDVSIFQAFGDDKRCNGFTGFGCTGSIEGIPYFA